MTIDIDDLKREEAEANEWENNPVKLAIQHALSGPLNNDNYRKKTPQQIADELEEIFKKDGLMSAKYLFITGSLLRKVRKSKTAQDAVVIIGEYLLS